MAARPDPDVIEVLADEILELKAEIAKLRASVLVLKTYVATLMMSGQTAAGLKQLESLEQQVLAADPYEKARKQSAQRVDAAKQLKKRGVREPDS